MFMRSHLSPFAFEDLNTPPSLVHVNGDMTGRENIYLNGAILGMSRAEVDSKIDDLDEFAEVEL